MNLASWLLFIPVGSWGMQLCKSCLLHSSVFYACTGTLCLEKQIVQLLKRLVNLKVVIILHLRRVNHISTNNVKHVCASTSYIFFSEKRYFIHSSSLLAGCHISGSTCYFTYNTCIRWRLYYPPNSLNLGIGKIHFDGA